MPSHLNHHKKRQFFKKTFGLLVLFIVVFFFITVIGLKFLLNTSLFVSNLFPNKSTVNDLEKKEDFYGSLTIEDIPTATNSAKIIVSGSVTNFDKIQFFISDEKVKETTLLSSDNFSEEIGDLKPGNNEVYVKTLTRNEDRSKISAKYTVTFKDQPPLLDIIEPKDQLRTNLTEVKVVGKTDKETYIKVNNLPIVVDSQGSFQTSVKLNEGENKIEIDASDIAGNIQSETVTVFYQKED